MTTSKIAATRLANVSSCESRVKIVAHQPSQAALLQALARKRLLCATHTIGPTIIGASLIIIP